MADHKKKVRNSKVGHIVKSGVYGTRLHNYIPFFETHIERLRGASAQNSADIQRLQKDVKALYSLATHMDAKISDMKHQALLDASKGRENIPATPSVNETMADDHSHDMFYKAFEDRFRGSEAMIRKRLLEYVPHLKNLPTPLKKLPILDLGCGRGEFLDVIQSNDFKAIGIDMNKSMVDRAKSLGYTAYENDALTYLLKQKPSSFAAITGFHLVEHIPFPALLKIFEECYRVVHPDGFVLFETPNPNNLTVGASNFYMDPSHIKPIPPKLLAFAMETQGFTDTQILELHPAHEDIKHDDPVIEDIMRMVYGPLDYAVLASKKPWELAA